MDAYESHGPMRKAFKLPPHRHALVATLLDTHFQTLRELGNGLGSPLHVVLPQLFAENVGRLQRLFVEHGIDATLLYAKKANKADAFARVCARLGVGVDVASCGELAKALAAGVIGENIGVSGPEKTDNLLTLALHHRSLIAIDSLSELRRIVPLAARYGTRARVLLRSRPASQPHSRFGLTPAEHETALELCTDRIQSIDLEGFSFHLGGYSMEQRARMASAMIDLCLQAQGRGLKTCRQIDIGGGLPVQYVAPGQWQAFLQQDEREHYHAGKSFAGFYPYGADRCGAEALRDLLEHRLDDGSNLSHRLRCHGIGLIIEPGRALLDQAGITLFEVQGIKDRHASDGHAIVTVRGSSLNLSEQWFNSEYLPDPQLLGQAGVDAQDFLACVGGATCLESDMVTWRKIAFPRPIGLGDWLVYLNTAGYQMDSNESPFHEAELPRKVVVELHDGATVPHWRLDGI